MVQHIPTVPIHIADLCGIFALLWVASVGYTRGSLAASVLLSLFVAAFGILLWSHTDFMLPTVGQVLANFVCWFHWILMFETWIIASPRRY